MAVIATLLNAVQSGLSWKIEIEYSDGVETYIISERFNGTTIAGLKDFARSKALRVDGVIDTFDFTTVIGQSIDVTPITPVPPTAEEIAKEVWFDDWAKLRQINTLLEQAPAISTASRIAFRDSLQSTVESNWLDSYLGDL